MEIWEPDTEYERIIHFNETKDMQVRLTVNVFMGVEYLHVREYYMDFDEKWCPTPKGCAMPLNLNNARQLFEGLVDLLADAESEAVIQSVLGEQYNISLK